MNEFIKKVAEMREAQKLYFETRKKGVLFRAKKLEKEVDAMLDEIENTKAAGVPKMKNPPAPPPSKNIMGPTK
ncbi:hypothetical protein L0P88_04125 [Muricauda sp. SCSIO 64092]|uniref:hypothetical protein n=1 Tax=Allomuricauda sp. SCSIO 64092 TaxID=2908842 RepID=UPI001FF5BB64|nr:hypothetical protein [Muricauda sp. SCSIO 64092]UOY07742.1 hypothetical protein L0P88_04125 [Muricauda sp. SCSIO 64092]